MTADAGLADAARFEVAQRERHYPLQVTNGQIGADDATVDFQAWHCILAWLESGRFDAIHFGGVDGDRAVGWAEADAAASSGAAAVAQALDAAGKAGDAGKAARLDRRLAALRLIAERVRRQRGHVDAINRRLRADAMARRPHGGAARAA